MLFFFLELQSLHHGLVAELAAHTVHRAFGGCAACRVLIDQVCGVGFLRVGEGGYANTKKAIARAVDLACEQLATD